MVGCLINLFQTGWGEYLTLNYWLSRIAESGNVPSWAEISDLTRAFAELFKALQWPFVALIISYFFRSEISKLLQRMKKGKVFGAEAEFESTLEKLEKGTSEEIADVPVAIPVTSEEPVNRDRDESRTSELVSKLATISPNAALMLLGKEIEQTVRKLVASWRVVTEVDESRIDRYGRYFPMRIGIELLSSIGVIDPILQENLINFLRIRSMVVHESAGDDSEILRAIDSGLKILAILETRFPVSPPQFPPDEPGSESETKPKESE